MIKCNNCHAEFENLFELAHHMEEEHMDLPDEPTEEDKAFDALETKLNAQKKHPLLNPESKHYQMVDGIESVERLEQMFTFHEMKIWAKITAMKYRMRIGNKDDVTKEVQKIKDYEAYYRFLDESS